MQDGYCNRLTVLLSDISSQIWLYFLSTHRWSLVIPQYSFSRPFVLNLTRTQIFQVLSIPSFDENNINVVGSVISTYQRVDIHICDSRIFVLILPVPTGPSHPVPGAFWWKWQFLAACLGSTENRSRGHVNIHQTHYENGKYHAGNH